MAIIGPTNSLTPRMAASSGDLPKCRFRSTFSTTTMASSTTSPTDNNMARRVRRFSEKPKSCMRKTAPIKDTGIATTGTKADRADPRNRNMTRTTMLRVSDRVLITSVMAVRIYSVASYPILALIPGGRSFCRASISSVTALRTSIALAFGRTWMPMKVAFRPEYLTSVS